MNLIPWLGFLITGYLGMTFINRTLDGSMFTTTDTAFLHDIRLTQPYDLGLFTLTGPNLSFVTRITDMANWQDYVIWGGLGQYVMIFCYALSFVILLTFGITLLSMAVNFFRPR